MRKVAPAVGQEVILNDQKTYMVVSRAIQIIANIVGISPAAINHEEKTIQFRLFSFCTLFSLIRLVVFNLPFTILPRIFINTLYQDKSESKVNETSILSKNASYWENYYNNITIDQIIMYLDYLSCYSYYIFPFLIASTVAKPNERIYRIITKPHNETLVKNIPGSKLVLPPAICFVLFVIGKLCKVVEIIQKVTGKIQPIQVYWVASFHMLASLGIQFFLAVQEFFFYQNNIVYGEFIKKTLLTIEEREKSTTHCDRPMISRGNEDPTMVTRKTEVTQASLDQRLTDLIKLMESLKEAAGPVKVSKYQTCTFYHCTWQKFLQGTNSASIHSKL